jgi:hypothetical protein
VTLSILGLTLSYVAMAVLLLVFLQYTTLRWGQKAAAILTISALYFVLYTSYSELLGWPADSPLPAHFKYHYSVIEEPSKSDPSRAGSIYIWITDVTTEQDFQKPRAYKVAYSQKTHKKLEVAQKKTQKGIKQLGEVVKEKKSSGIGDVLEKGSVTLNFYDLAGMKINHK